MKNVPWFYTLTDGIIRVLVVAPEKAIAPHSSTLAWKIPWTEEPGGLQSMGLLRDGHGWVTSLSLFTFMHWRRKWQRTPVFLPGESQGRGSLVGCRLWGLTESDTTDMTQQQQQQFAPLGPGPILPLPSSFSPRVTTSLFYLPSLFLLSYWLLCGNFRFHM